MMECDAPLVSANVTVGFVLAGAFTKPEPLPVFCFTVTVNVWGAPVSLVAVSGVIVMYASTNVLTAGPVLPSGPAGIVVVTGLVSRVRLTPPTEKVTDALLVTTPADCDVNVTVQVPLVVPLVKQLSVLTS